MSRIVFCGMVAGDPGQGGATWAVLQYVLGWRKLGHEVLLLEPVRSSAPEASVCGYFDAVVQRFGLAGHAALRFPDGRCHGMARDAVAAACRNADVLFNVSGMLTDEQLLAAIPRRVFLDLDPVFNQLWQVAEGIDMHLSNHQHFVTVGMNVGRAGCPVPDGGVTWMTTLPPVALEHWTVDASPPVRGLTTIANWRGYGSITHGGVHYGQKAHSLRRFINLPKRLSGMTMELALAIHPDETADLEALARHGWRLLDPVAAAGTPDRYRDFIRSSFAEFGIAKSGYVAGRSGWFSDRSACYLASGRPVIAQGTGFEEHLPVGEGLLVFDSIDAVAVALDALRSDYGRHARKARELAEGWFSADRVLPRLLEQVGAG